MNDPRFLKLKELVHEFAIVNPKDVPFREYVVDACAMNYCGRYGKTWQCPPGVGSLEHLKEKCLAYKKAVVFTTVHPIEDSFDIEGNFMPEDELKGVTKYDFYIFGKHIETGIRD